MSLSLDALPETYRAWCEGQLRQIPGKAEIAKAMRYGLRRWPALTLFLKDGRVAIDTDVFETPPCASGCSLGDSTPF